MTNRSRIVFTTRIIEGLYFFVVAACRTTRPLTREDVISLFQHHTIPSLRHEILCTMTPLLICHFHVSLLLIRILSIFS